MLAARHRSVGAVTRFERTLADGVITVRPFDPSDRDALVRGRDDEFHRFLGEGSPGRAPVACICAGPTIVGWIDYDHDRPWLAAGEVNVGYSVFPAHRRKGYGTRALRLLRRFVEAHVPPLGAPLLIDPDNAALQALAARADFAPVGTVDDQVLFKPRASHS